MLSSVAWVKACCPKLGRCVLLYSWKIMVAVVGLTPVARNVSQQVEDQCTPRQPRWCDHSPRARHPGMWSPVGLIKITTNKASGGDGIPVELFQILQDDAMKVLHSICQQIWKTQQWPQDWKRSVFIPIPMKGNAKECSNYCTIAFI